MKETLAPWRRIGAEKDSKVRMWRSHPVLFAFAIGAALGFSNAAILMFTEGILKVLMNPLLVILWPTSIFGMEDLGGPPAFTRFLIFISLVGNSVLYGFLFATPIGFMVAVRRSFGTPEKPTSIGRM
jgi:hypothetical protein